MSPLALGRHGSPNLSPANSFDQPSASLQRMYSVDLPTLPVGPTVVQHPSGQNSENILKETNKVTCMFSLRWLWKGRREFINSPYIGHIIS